MTKTAALLTSTRADCFRSRKTASSGISRLSKQTRVSTWLHDHSSVAGDHRGRRRDSQRTGGTANLVTEEAPGSPYTRKAGRRSSLQCGRGQPGTIPRCDLPGEDRPKRKRGTSEGPPRSSGDFVGWMADGERVRYAGFRGMSDKEKLPALQIRFGRSDTRDGAPCVEIDKASRVTLQRQNSNACGQPAKEDFLQTRARPTKAGYR